MFPAEFLIFFFARIALLADIFHPLLERRVHSITPVLALLGKGRQRA
jgi:hypothetical protein